MSTTHTENRKLSAWIGSLLFHAALLLLVLLWFSFSTGSDKSAPGERIAVGSIILQPSDGSRQQAETAMNDPQSADSEQTTVETGTLSQIDLTILPPIPALSPGQNQTLSQPGAASATELTTSLNSVSGNTGMGSQTGEATVRVFGVDGKGTKFMYVFDRSGSMEGTPIRAAKAELIRSLDSLADNHQFNIIFYSSSWNLWQTGRKLVFATESEKQNAVRFVSAITPDGGTGHFEPLKEAIAHRPDVIFFLTDGESQDDLTAAQLREIEQRNSRFGQRGTQINVIQFGSGSFMDSPSRSLQQLAEQNFGQYRYVNVSLLQ